mmetsp:Transcript_16803/g.41272  ORF Transcript_16803/g.41272 Transcript_16803/m.41272 type:complete len:309 (-) Transcript_16803:97-1023(-)
MPMRTKHPGAHAEKNGSVIQRSSVSRLRMILRMLISDAGTRSPPPSSSSSSESASPPSPSSVICGCEPAMAKRCKRSSLVPTARRRPKGSTSRLQHSAPSAAMVCAQCCVSRSHTRTVLSLLHVTRRAPAETPTPPDPPPPPPPPPFFTTPTNAPPTSTNTASVIWSLCPRRRHRPVSATTSHTTTLVSLPPDTSSDPPALKRSAVTSERCPLRRTSVLPSSSDHRRMEPSKAPAATRSLPSARAMRVTAGTTPLSRCGGTRLLASTPRRTSHTLRRSSAAVTRCRPLSSYTGEASGDATTPNARACS